LFSSLPNNVSCHDNPVHKIGKDNSIFFLTLDDTGLVYYMLPKETRNVPKATTTT